MARPPLADGADTAATWHARGVTIIALTGGIASGKSTISQRLAEHGAVIVDADRIVREVQEPGTPTFDRIVEEFSPAVLTPDGSLDRAALGAIVFGNDTALRRLNAIVHPAVMTESRRQFEAALAADPDAFVVYDIPLLVETHADDRWDRVVVAHAPADIRAERLVRLRGMSEQEAAARIAAQVGDEERLSIATDVIDTSGRMEDTLAQVDALWERLHP